MKTNVQKLAVVTVLAVLMVCTASQVAFGRLLAEVQRARQIVQAPSFQIGSFVRNPRTLEIRDLTTLFHKATGGVRQKSTLKHIGDFESYWKASFTGRSGKAFEAYEVYRANRKLARLGRSERFVITAVEGSPHHAADVVLIDGTGKITKQFQHKLGVRAALNAIKDPKYAGMTIVTPRNSLSRIRRDLKEAIRRAASSEKGLPPKWQHIQNALAEGRLTDEMLPGLQVWSRKQIERIAKCFTKPMFTAVEKQMPRTSRLTMAVSRGISRVGLRAGSATLKIAGKVMGPADLMFVGYQTHLDWQRFSNGEIGEGTLATKFTLRGAEVAVAILLLSPDPGTKVILVGITASLLLTGADASLDAAIDARNARVQQLLENINRDERFDAVKEQLMEDIEGATPDNLLRESDHVEQTNR